MPAEPTARDTRSPTGYPPPHLPDLEIWSAARRAASLAETMRDRPEGPIWVFGYGSLIWNPCFQPARSQVARMADHARRTCFWTIHSRGTRERPGLAFGLDAVPGHQCQGVVHQLGEERLDRDLPAIWEREMYSGMYRPAWRALATDGGTVTALAFVAERDHPQYAGELSIDAQARIIFGARGVFGPCADYFRDTLAGLTGHGLADPELEALMARIDALES